MTGPVLVIVLDTTIGTTPLRGGRPERPITVGFRFAQRTLRPSG